MPQLIRTPEQILREEYGKDLYFITFEDAEPFSWEPSPGHMELLAWFNTTLPHVKIELLGPSEKSGILCGVLEQQIRVDFDAESVAIFSARWENEQGASIDARWQCYGVLYEPWLMKNYPRTSQLLLERQSLTLISGETMNLFSLTPLYSEETGLPCTLGIYQKMNCSLTPAVILYRGNDIDNHAWVPLEATQPAIIGNSGLSEKNIARCRKAIVMRHFWLSDIFDYGYYPGDPAKILPIYRKQYRTWQGD